MPFRTEYEICKLLKCTPNDKQFTDLTTAQRLWFALNIQKDKVESAEQLKILCQHIQPGAYFKNENPDAVSTDFLAGIEAQLGRELTPAEKVALNLPEPEPQYEDIDEDADVDIIERA